MITIENDVEKLAIIFLRFKVSRRKLAKKADLHYDYLGKIVNGQRKMSEKSRRKINSGLILLGIDEKI